MYKLSIVQTTCVFSALVFPVTIPNAARLSHSSRGLSSHLPPCIIAGPTPRYIDFVQLSQAEFCQPGTCDKKNITANLFRKSEVKELFRARK